MLGGAAADRHHVVVREGLLYIVESAFVHGLNRGLERRLRRHQDDRGFGILSADGGQDLDAGDAGHLEIGQDDVGCRALELLQAGLAPLRGRNVEALVLQQDAEGLEDSLFVVYDEDRWSGGHYAASSLRPAACTALRTRFETTRCSRSSSPSIGVGTPSSVIFTPAAQSGCWRTSRMAASATECRSTGRHSVTRTREKSRNSESKRDSRSLSRTIRLARNFSSEFARDERPSCSTELRMDASGFLISCARLDDSSATASSRSARRCSSSKRLESEMSVKMAETRGRAPTGPSRVVVVTPIGKL